MWKYKGQNLEQIKLDADVTLFGSNLCFSDLGCDDKWQKSEITFSCCSRERESEHNVLWPPATNNCKCTEDTIVKAVKEVLKMLT